MTTDSNHELYEVLLKLKNEEDCRILLEDLCTYKEVEQMCQRVKAAKMLKAGNTYQQVEVATEISSATLSRVSRCLQHGSGGYKKFID